MTVVPEYDPRVIEQFAEKLYRKASAFVAGSVAIGATLGAAFGAVPLTSLGEAWPIPSIFGLATLLVGGIFGAVIGYVIGDTRSFGYRLQAQAALCQLQAERNTAEIARAVVAARTARAQQRPARRVEPTAARPGPQVRPEPAQPPSPAPQSAQEQPQPPVPPLVPPPVTSTRVAS